MRTIVLLVLVTICYAAYNLLVKASTNSSGSITTAPILATIALQATALTVSIVYLIHLTRENVSVALPAKAFFWAMGAGLCIGLAEIMYFYLFRGFPGEKGMEASAAIPFIVGGTIAIAVAVSILVFGESLKPMQWAGVSMAFAGMIILALSST